MLGDSEFVRRLHVVLDRVKITAKHTHVASVVLEVEGIGTDVQGNKTVGGLQLVGTEPLGVGAKLHPVVAVDSLGIACTTGKDEVDVLVVVVGHAVVVAVDDDTAVLPDDIHQRGQLCVVARGRDVAVVDLQKLPFGAGLGERLLQEVDLLLCGLVAGLQVRGLVDRGRFLVGVDEAVRLHDDKGSGPVGANQVVGVVGQVLMAEVPAVIHEGSNAGLEVDGLLTLDHVVVAQALVPGLAIKGGAIIHARPRLVEAQDALGLEVDTAVVEIVADRDEGGAVLLQAHIFNVLSSFLYCTMSIHDHLIERNG